jgi:hypothetical protein
MHSRWYTVSVVLLWLTTMGWLVKEKVLPSLVMGEPPDYQAILDVQRGSTIGWRMLWDDRKIGWAVTSTSPVANGLTEVRSHVHFEELPLQEIVPEWLAGMLRPFGTRRAPLRMDVCSTLTFDPLDRLSQFESVIRFQPKVEALKLRGRIEGAKLLLTVHCGEIQPYETEVPAPRNSIVNDGLAPLGFLPRLRKGQRWTVETYSPLRPSTSPGEILHASVDDRMPLVWNGQVKDTWLVVYRSDPGSALVSAGSPCGKLWVNTRDGMILQQQAAVLRSTLKFIRTPKEEAVLLAKEAGEDRS